VKKEEIPTNPAKNQIKSALPIPLTLEAQEATIQKKTPPPPFFESQFLYHIPPTPLLLTPAPPNIIHNQEHPLLPHHKG